LREKARPVEDFTPSTGRLVDDMAETMYAARGVGLAATQIGEPHRVFLVDIAAEDGPSNLVVFINPEIASMEGLRRGPEGCLSFPGVSEEIERAARVRVLAVNRRGEPFELEAEGLLAVAVQHELDHLNGVLMIDRMSALKRRIALRKLSKR
jgi:peptide deformylase